MYPFSYRRTNAMIQRIFTVLLLGILVCSPNMLRAGDIEYVIQHEKSRVGTATIMLLEDPRIMDFTSIFHHKSYTGIAALVYGREDFTDKAGQVWTYTVSYDLLDEINNVTRTGSITISNNNHEGVYESIGIHENMGYRMRLKVTNVTSTGTVPNDVRLEFRMKSERYDDLSNVFPHAITLKTGSAAHPDLKDDQTMICWPYVEGAESYEIEWAFWDDQNNQTNPNTDLIFTQSITAETYQNYYIVDLVYPQGKVYFRVRAVGRYVSGVNGNYTYRRYTTWSAEQWTAVNFEDDYNWQFTRSFAEDGKHKEVVNYFDDGLKSRQTLTTLSSDETTIIAEQLYDAESRPTLSILPVPVSNHAQTGNPLQFGSQDTLAGKLLYHPSGNQVAYDRTNFDKRVGIGLSKADPLPQSHIANQYYSNQNPFLNTDDHMGYIPDANNYPMAQVEYLNDGTGRVKRQSGVGDFYQIGTDRETQYFYSNPTNTELRRMFGSNVGYATHYRKNIVRDANGQLTTSYIDQAGQTIATAMLGATPQNVLPLDGSSKTYTESLMGSNSLNELDRTSIVQHQLFSDQDNNVHTFTYDLTKGVMLSDGADFCVDCSYEVEFKILDLDGNGVSLNLVSSNTFLTYSNDTTLVFAFEGDSTFCDSGYYSPNVPIVFNATLNLGSYRVYKILRVTGPSLEELEKEALSSGMLISQDSFTNNFVRNNIDSSQCGPCNDAYREELIAQLIELTDSTFTRVDSQFWVQVDSMMLIHTECTALLDAIALQSFFGQGNDCLVMLEQMKRDLSPGGCLYQDSFYHYALLTASGAYRHRDSFPLTLTTKDGTIHDLHSIHSYLGFISDPNEWRDEWIDDLVKVHPEYVRYVRCALDDCYKQSKIYDFDLMRYNNWAEFLADHAPHLDTATATDMELIQAVIAADPLTSCNLGGKILCTTNEIKGVLKNYCASMAATNVSTSSGAIPVSCGCTNQPPSEQATVLCYIRNNLINPPLGTTTFSHSSPPSNLPTFDAEDYWDMFRGIYANEKKSYEYNCPVIKYPANFSRTACPQVAGESQMTYRDNNGNLQTIGITDMYNVDTLAMVMNGVIGNNSTGNSICDRMCSANARQWMNQLCPSLQSIVSADTVYRTIIYEAFLEYCQTGCGNMGYPDPPNGNGLQNPMGFLLREDVDTAMAAINAIPTQYNPTNPLQRALATYDSLSLDTICTDIYTIIAADSTITRSFNSVYCTISSQNDPRTALVSADKCQEMVDFFIGINSSNLFPIRWTSTTGNPYVSTQLYNSSMYPSNRASQHDGQLYFAEFDVIPNMSILYNMARTSAQVTITNIEFNNRFIYEQPITSNSRLLSVDRFIDFKGPFIWAYDGGSTCKFDFGIEFWDAGGNAINPFDIVGLVPNSYNCSNNMMRIIVVQSSCQWFGGSTVGTACNNPSTQEIEVFVRMRFNNDVCIPDWETSQDTTVRLCDSSWTYTIDTDVATSDCIQFQIQFLQNQSLNLYNNYRDSVLSLLVNDSCLNVEEAFSVRKTQTEQHYTLYYYDEAGNLIQTIPPAGVNLLSEGDPTAFNFGGKWLGKEPEHDTLHFTRYKYNTLGQVVEQVSPDGGKTVFWYDYAQRLRLSQSARYVNASNYGVGGKYAYTKYDRKGRIIEVGRLDNYTVDPLDISTQNFPDNTTTKAEVIHTEYDELSFIPTGFSSNALNQRGRVVRTYNDNIATYYDYDIHGNVKTLYHQIKNFGAAEIQYDYDLITGNVNEVRFMEGTDHEFRHRYRYDADNRLTHAFTSQDGYIWERDARYFYYPHGPLMRCEKGEDNIQGEDYYYTLQGWIKGVNMVEANIDLGKDSDTSSTNPNRWFGQDEMAYLLGYNKADYTPIGNTSLGLMDVNGTNAFNSEILFGAGQTEGLFNGNIAFMITHIPGLSNAGAMPTQAMAYQYDALHRIKRGVSFFPTNGTWSETNPSIPLNGGSYKYDANGNIIELNRNADGIGIDRLTYQYNPNKPNQLLRIIDNMASATVGDITTQPVNNYSYDEIGNLIADQSEQITQIDWNFQNKIEKVTYARSSGRNNLVYSYGPDGTRLSKTSVNINELETTTLYIRDASGNIMATYDLVNEKRLNPEDPAGSPSVIGVEYSKSLKEVALYGSSRLGMKQYPQQWEVYTPIAGNPVNMSEALAVADRTNWVSSSTRGKKYYEFSNHLGNVLSICTDKKAYEKDAVTGLFRYKAHVISAQDYYPFGLEMYGRKYNSNTYRFGFNGKENDREYGSQLVQDYGFRIYNPAAARFLSEDPLTGEYPMLTPYQFASNGPIVNIDLDGLEAVNYEFGRLEYNSSDGFFTAPLKFAVNTLSALGNGVIGTANYTIDVGSVAVNEGVVSAGGKVVSDAVIEPSKAVYNYVTTTPIEQMGVDAYNFGTDVQTYENFVALLATRRIALPKGVKSKNTGNTTLQIAIKETPLGDASHIKLSTGSDWYGYSFDKNNPGYGVWQREKVPSGDYTIYQTKIESEQASKLNQSITEQGENPTKYNIACNNCSTNATKTLNRTTHVKTSRGGVPTTVVNPKSFKQMLDASEGFQQVQKGNPRL